MSLSSYMLYPFLAFPQTLIFFNERVPVNDSYVNNLDKTSIQRKKILNVPPIIVKVYYVSLFPIQYIIFLINHFATY